MNSAFERARPTTDPILYKTLLHLTDSLPHILENSVLISIDVRAAPGS